jgi:hypothetical protein
MKVTNQTSDQEQIKICLYRPNDAVVWIPVGAGVFTVARGSTTPWEPPTGEEIPKYWLKAFHPAFFDTCLAKGEVDLNANVVVRGGGGDYRLDT